MYNVIDEVSGAILPICIMIVPSKFTVALFVDWIFSGDKRTQFIRLIACEQLESFPSSEKII